MALGKSVNVRSGLVAPNAYHRIKMFEFTNATVPSVVCLMEVWADQTSRTNLEEPILRVKFNCSDNNLLTGNIMQRLYNHLKTLIVNGIDYTSGTTDL